MAPQPHNPLRISIPAPSGDKAPDAGGGTALSSVFPTLFPASASYAAGTPSAAPKPPFPSSRSLSAATGPAFGASRGGLIPCTMSFGRPALLPLPKGDQSQLAHHRGQAASEVARVEEDGVPSPGPFSGAHTPKASRKSTAEAAGTPASWTPPQRDKGAREHGERAELDGGERAAFSEPKKQRFKGSGDKLRTRGAHGQRLDGTRGKKKPWHAEPGVNRENGDAEAAVAARLSTGQRDRAALSSASEFQGLPPRSSSVSRIPVASASTGGGAAAPALERYPLQAGSAEPSLGSHGRRRSVPSPDTGGGGDAKQDSVPSHGQASNLPPIVLVFDFWRSTILSVERGSLDPEDVCVPTELLGRSLLAFVPGLTQSTWGTAVASLAVGEPVQELTLMFNDDPSLGIYQGSQARLRLAVHRRTGQERLIRGELHPVGWGAAAVAEEGSKELPEPADAPKPKKRQEAQQRAENDTANTEPARANPRPQAGSRETGPARQMGASRPNHPSLSNSAYRAMAEVPYSLRATVYREPAAAAVEWQGDRTPPPRDRTAFPSQQQAASSAGPWGPQQHGHLPHLTAGQAWNAAATWHPSPQVAQQLMVVPVYGPVPAAYSLAPPMASAAWHAPRYESPSDLPPAAQLQTSVASWQVAPQAAAPRAEVYFSPNLSTVEQKPPLCPARGSPIATLGHSRSMSLQGSPFNAEPGQWRQASGIPPRGAEPRTYERPARVSPTCRMQMSEGAIGRPPLTDQSRGVDRAGATGEDHSAGLSQHGGGRQLSSPEAESVRKAEEWLDQSRGVECAAHHCAAVAQHGGGRQLSSPEAESVRKAEEWLDQNVGRVGWRRGSGGPRGGVGVGAAKGLQVRSGGEQEAGYMGLQSGGLSMLSMESPGLSRRSKSLAGRSEMGPKEALLASKEGGDAGLRSSPSLRTGDSKPPRFSMAAHSMELSRKEPAQGHPLLVKAKTFSVHTSTQLKPCGSQSQLETLWATNGASAGTHIDPSMQSAPSTGHSGPFPPLTNTSAQGAMWPSPDGRLEAGGRAGSSARKQRDDQVTCRSATMPVAANYGPLTDALARETPNARQALFEGSRTSAGFLPPFTSMPLHGRHSSSSTGHPSGVPLPGPGAQAAGFAAGGYAYGVPVSRQQGSSVWGQPVGLGYAGARHFAAHDLGYMHQLRGSAEGHAPWHWVPQPGTVRLTGGPARLQTGPASQSYSETGGGQALQQMAQPVRETFPWRRPQTDTARRSAETDSPWCTDGSKGPADVLLISVSDASDSDDGSSELGPSDAEDHPSFHGPALAGSVAPEQPKSTPSFRPKDPCRRQGSLGPLEVLVVEPAMESAHKTAASSVSLLRIDVRSESSESNGDGVPLCMPSHGGGARPAAFPNENPESHPAHTGGAGGEPAARPKKNSEPHLDNTARPQIGQGDRESEALEGSGGDAKSGASSVIIHEDCGAEEEGGEWEEEESITSAEEDASSASGEDREQQRVAHASRLNMGDAASADGRRDPDQESSRDGSKSEEAGACRPSTQDEGIDAVQIGGESSGSVARQARRGGGHSGATFGVSAASAINSATGRGPASGISAASGRGAASGRSVASGKGAASGMDAASSIGKSSAWPGARASVASSEDADGACVLETARAASAKLSHFPTEQCHTPLSLSSYDSGSPNLPAPEEAWPSAYADETGAAEEEGMSSGGARPEQPRLDLEWPQLVAQHPDTASEAAVKVPPRHPFKEKGRRGERGRAGCERGEAGGFIHGVGFYERTEFSREHRRLTAEAIKAMKAALGPPSPRTRTVLWVESLEETGGGGAWGDEDDDDSVAAFSHPSEEGLFGLRERPSKAQHSGRREGDVPRASHKDTRRARERHSESDKAWNQYGPAHADSGRGGQVQGAGQRPHVSNQDADERGGDLSLERRTAGTPKVRRSSTMGSKAARNRSRSWSEKQSKGSAGRGEANGSEMRAHKEQQLPMAVEAGGQQVRRSLSERWPRNAVALKVTRSRTLGRSIDRRKDCVEEATVRSEGAAWLLSRKMAGTPASQKEGMEVPAARAPRQPLMRVPSVTGFSKMLWWLG